MSTNMKKTTINELKRLGKVSGGGINMGNINADGNVKLIDKSVINDINNSQNTNNTKTNTTIKKTGFPFF